jgi:predicted Zn-dependent protease
VIYRQAHSILIAACLFLFAGCGKDITTLEEQVLYNRVQTQENLGIFFGPMSTLSVKVFYEPGAEPYTGQLLLHYKAWQLLEHNLKEIFTVTRGQIVTYDIPQELGEMTQIPTQNKSTWTADALLSLANQYGNTQSTTTTGRFVILYVKGHFQNAGVVQNNVLGINITGTTVIVVFKDVVNQAGTSHESTTARFAEMSTVIHEMGHALGTVNNGIPITTEHHDSAHGAHCSNPDCVMYWQNEGGSLFNFVQRFLLTGSTKLFGSECMKDFELYAPATPTTTPTP